MQIHRQNSGRAAARGWPARGGGRWLSLCACAAAVAGCSADLGSGGASPDTDCNISGCPSGQVCTVNNECVPDTDDTLRVALRIVPADGSSYLPEQRTNLRVEPPAEHQIITLNDPTTLSGAVTMAVAGSNQGQPVVSRITFTREGGIPQVPIQREAVTGPNGSYTLELVPGSYRVTVRVEEESRPPFRPRDPFTVSGTSQLYNILLPAVEEFYSVQGTLLRSVPDGETAVPVRDARVSLVSSTSGATVSTVAVSDVAGTFSLTVTPNEPGYQLVVAPAEMNGPVPELTYPTVFDLAGDPVLGELLLGEWADERTVSGTIFGQNGAQIAVADATIFFEQALEIGRYTQLVRAQDEGRFSATLIPGDYQVTIVPPVDAVYGAGTFEETLAADGGAEVNPPPLGHKPVLSGRVTGPDGEGLAGVTVRAEPTSYGVRLLDLGPVSTLTNADGSYELAVHPGRHRLTVQPVPGSHLAPLIVELGDVLSDSPLDVALERAHTLAGTITTPPGGPPLDGPVTVEAYVWVDDDTAVSFAVTETGADGGFVVDLPTLGL